MAENIDIKGNASSAFTGANIERKTGIKILISGVEIGTILSLKGAESRTNVFPRTYGGDVETPKAAIYGLTDTRTLDFTGLTIFGRAIVDVLGNADGKFTTALKNLTQQKVPFDIEKISENPYTNETIVDKYEGCLIDSVDYDWDLSSTTNGTAVSESGKISYVKRS